MTQPVQGEVLTLSGIVNRLAGLLRHAGGALSTRDVAALRRMNPTAPPAAFFKLEGLALDDVLHGDGKRRDLDETRWAAVINGLAQMGNLHRSDAPLGRALGDAGFADLRFARLLRADADRLVVELPMLARYLVARDAPADWSDAARLMFSAGRADEETVRRRIAREYYRVTSRSGDA
jgi:CRISPR system Cascade subunit CasB